jgi:hypothetical protein
MKCKMAVTSEKRENVSKALKQTLELAVRSPLRLYKVSDRMQWKGRLPPRTQKKVLTGYEMAV